MWVVSYYTCSVQSLCACVFILLVSRNPGRFDLCYPPPPHPPWVLGVAMSGIDKSTKISYFLATTKLLWMWQSAQPTLDNVLPFLEISINGLQLRPAASIKENEKLDSSSIFISVSEILAMCVGVATMVSLYSLYWVCTEGRAKFWQNLAFILLATLASVGYGMHAVCVIAQLQISRDNPLYALLDFMHERWSHNMFQFGMFSLFLLVVWSEKQHSGKTVRLKSITSVWWNATSSWSLSSVLPWLGTVITGVFMSIFSNRTETGHIALAFYISIAVSIYLFMRLLKYDVFRMMLMFGQYPMLTFYLSVSMYGVPTLFIHYWFFM